MLSHIIRTKINKIGDIIRDWYVAMLVDWSVCLLHRSTHNTNYNNFKDAIVCRLRVLLLVRGVSMCVCVCVSVCSNRSTHLRLKYLVNLGPKLTLY